MIIPHFDKPREDTGLYNGKAGIWIFLASEVMLFGGVFSAYILLRVGADDGTWSMGLMNKWVGAFNTLILIASSATIVLAWVCLKLKDFAGYRKWQWITIVFATMFLVVKWSYEWPAKFTHYDVKFTSEDAAKRAMVDALGSPDDVDKAKTEKAAADQELAAMNTEVAKAKAAAKTDDAKKKHADLIATQLEPAKKKAQTAKDALEAAVDAAYEAKQPKVKEIWQDRFDPGTNTWDKVDLKNKPLDGHIVAYIDSEGKRHKVDSTMGFSFWSHAFVWRFDRKNLVKNPDGSVKTNAVGNVLYKGIELNGDETLKRDEHGNVVYQEGAIPYHDTFRDRDIQAIVLHPAGNWHSKQKQKHTSGGTLKYAEKKGDSGTDAGDGGHGEVIIQRQDISRLSSYEPAHSTFFATYYTLTGLHALHVLGGILVMLYHLLPISRRVYEANAEQFTNRIEVTGLFWHFVDLVWIFLFPILYLL